MLSGLNRSRTGDLLDAIEALSRLSYKPVWPDYPGLLFFATAAPLRSRLSAGKIFCKCFLKIWRSVVNVLLFS